MSDNVDSTLSSIIGDAKAAVEQFLFDAADIAEVPPEAELRHQTHALALGVAYAWATRDKQAQDAFLDELVEMPHGLGMTLAVEVLTEIRLYGLRPGSLRPGTEVDTQWTPADDPAVRPDNRTDPGNPDWRDTATPSQREQVEIVTDLWSGLGTWDAERVTLARVRLARLPRTQLREVLRIMAFDAYKIMDQFASWQGLGSETVEDFRTKHPQDYEVVPAGSGSPRHD